MKTDLQAAQKQINELIESFRSDSSELAATETPEALRLRSLIGHSISGLTGVATNLQGMMPKPEKPAKKRGPVTDQPAAS
jgi:hypothetical protein